MSDEHPTTSSPLDPEERHFLSQIDAHYQPAPMTPARRAALDARVRERVERRGLRGRLAPGLVAASVAALAVWIVLPVEEGSVVESGLRVAARDVGAQGSPWESRLFHGDLGDSALEEAEGEFALPADYAAIASVFIDE